MKFLRSGAVAGTIWAMFGLASADAQSLLFSARVDTGETVSFFLDTTVPNTYDPALYPGFVRGVYLNAVYGLNFEGVSIPVSDVAMTPAVTGGGQPLTFMDVGPLFDNESLSLQIQFLDPALVSPLSSDPLAYESSFRPFPGSILFPQIPPPRTHVSGLLSLTVSDVPEPASLFLLGVGAVGFLMHGLGRAARQPKANRADAGGPAATR
jgi:hypothetical protein